MANIPTILNDSGLQSARQPIASTQAFGSQVGEATQGLGASLQQVTNLGVKLLEMKKGLDDDKWVGDSISQEKNYINKWMADPANHTKESFDSDLNDLMEKRLAEYEKSAPSQNARIGFRQAFQSFGVSRFDSATQTAAANKITNLQLSVNGQIDETIDSYRVTRNIPNVDANEDLINNIDQVSGRIDKTFGTIAPAMAKQLKTKLKIDAVYATMNDTPDLAKRILNSGGIEGRTYHTLESEINQAENVKNVTHSAQFEEYRKNWLTLVQSGNKQDKIDLVLYQSIYPRDQAVAQKLRDDVLIDIYNKSNDFVNKVKPWNATEQIRELSKMQSEIGKNPDTAYTDQKAFELAHERILGENGLVMQSRKDPVTYQVQNNPAIKSLSDKIASMPDDPKDTRGPKALAVEQMYDLIFKYQGSPNDLGHFTEEELLKGINDPAYVPKSSDDEKKLYLSAPRTQVHIQSKATAEAAAAQINHGSPKDALKSIDQILSQYPEKYRAVAFNDMVTLPGDKGIDGSFWAAYLNKNSMWIDDYLGAIQNAQDIKKASNSKSADYEKAMDTNPAWRTFQNPLAGDNYQRQNLVEGFRSGILTYAMALSQSRGLTPEAAVKTAASRILNENMGAIHVNGETLMVPRQSEDGTVRDNKTIDDMGRRLQIALEGVDVRELKLQDDHGRSLFPSLNLAGTEETKQAALRNAILTKGTFTTTPDGTAAVLYMRGDDHNFELRTKDNKALMIRFENLPAFSVGPAVKGLFGFNLGVKTERPNQPGMPIITEERRKPTPQDDPITYAFTGTVGTGIFHTNWPTMPDYIERVKR